MRTTITESRTKYLGEASIVDDICIEAEHEVGETLEVVKATQAILKEWRFFQNELEKLRDKKKVDV